MSRTRDLAVAPTRRAEPYGDDAPAPDPATAAWAGLDLAPASCDGPGRAAFGPGRLAAATRGGDADETLNLTLRLGAGLWRLEAGLVGADGAARFWRLESAFLPAATPLRKRLPLPAGALLTVRAVETLAAADAAARAAMDAGRAAPRTVPLVRRVRERLAQARAQCARGARDRAVRSVHDALQFLGQAEALARNAGLPGEPWDACTEALSQVSATACNLIPHQESDPAGRLVVSLRNAGGRPLAHVALSPSPEGALRLFAVLPPGRTARAAFPMPAGTPCGWARYILHGGAAALPLRVGPDPIPS